MRPVATYQEIQQWVLEHYGFKPETCWIAHRKEINGLPIAEAPNRQAVQRAKHCPPEKRPAIKKAFEHLVCWLDRGGNPRAVIRVNR